MIQRKGNGCALRIAPRSQPLRAVLLAVLLSSIAGMAAPLRASLDSGSWPMFHRDAGHTGLSPLLAPEIGVIAWTRSLSDTVEFSSPAVTSSATVLVGDQGKELWAFDLWGNERWNYHALGNIRYSSPAVRSNGTVYFGAGDGKLYAVWPSGRLAWSVQTGAAVKTSPAIAPDGTIYAGSDDGSLWAVRADGSVKFTFATGDTVRSSPALAADGTIVFGSHDGMVRALWPNGSLRWEVATGGPIKTAPAIRQNHVIVASSDGFLYDFSIDGTFNWATYTGNNLRSSPAFGSTGKIYLGVDTKISCFHDDGSPSFSYETGAKIYSSPAVTSDYDGQDIVLCGSDSGYLYAVKAGTLLWSCNLGAPVRSSPAIGPNRIAYVGAMNGNLYAIGYVNPASAGGDAATSTVGLALSPNPVRGDSPVSIHLLDPRGAGRLGDAPILILDPSGRRIRSLQAAAGEGIAVWDGRDMAGRRVPAGVYWIRVGELDRRTSTRLVRIP
ncbi:MAG: PQQ-binding-like beta-propeller repeat protein [Candidatus Eisenbacteria bacterium]